LTETGVGIESRYHWPAGEGQKIPCGISVGKKKYASSTRNIGVHSRTNITDPDAETAGQIAGPIVRFHCMK